MDNRGQVGWDEKVWASIDKAVHDEIERTTIARKFLPLYMGMADANVVPADTVTENVSPLEVDPSKQTAIIEARVPFALTQEQVNKEAQLGTALTLATRAANLLSQVEDLILFQGKSALNNILIKGGGAGIPPKVIVRSNPQDEGLLSGASTIDVPPLDPVVPGVYGENTFKAVAQAYSDLQGRGHYGPYALILPTSPYADTYAPLKTTLIMPADRIKPLVSAGFFGTGTLPTGTQNTKATGILLSIGGNTMDLVIGIAAMTLVLQFGVDKRYQFEVFERFALRFKDTTAAVKLLFQ